MLFAVGFLMGIALPSTSLEKTMEEAKVQGEVFKDQLHQIQEQAQKRLVTEKQSCGSCKQSLILEQPPKLEEDHLLVFVSHTMPLESLKILAQEAKANGARLVTRGLKERSFKKTAQWVQEVGHSVDIDPPLFRRYEVTHVPTFIVISNKSAYRFRGNVSLSYVLDKAKGLD